MNYLNLITLLLLAAICHTTAIGHTTSNDGKTNNAPLSNTTVVLNKPLTLSDLNKTGDFLLSVSLISILVNGLLIGLLCKNWGQIHNSLYCNLSLFCLLLTSSDLALALLLGAPVGIRLIFEEELGNNKSMVYYTENIGFLLFEYLYMVRVITVAVISADRCFHILRLLKYLLIATKWRVKAACEIIVILPLLRIAPMIQVLRMLLLL